MPAKYQKRVDTKNTYFHILNRSNQREVLFGDEEDYKVFISYLKDYLSPLAHPSTYKKEFTINGRTFEGTPHKNKNYFKDINLIAYDLKPNHFHLLLHQKAKGSMEKFMRSLSTRYSMYYNKKYSRSGKLFEGPYKSIHIDKSSPLLLLTHYLHKNPESDIYNMKEVYSSYEEYLGKRETSWVKPKAILSFFNSSKDKIFDKYNTYQKFVEQYNLTQKDKKVLEGITLEKKARHLLKSAPSLESSTPSENNQPTYGTHSTHIISSVAVFIVLFSIGLNNVITTSAEDSATQSIASKTPTPIVIGEKTEKPKLKIVVKIENGTDGINIREKPTISSETIGEAKSDDAFEFVSINSGWYGVRLDNNEVGYIHSKYIETYQNE